MTRKQKHDPIFRGEGFPSHMASESDKKDTEPTRWAGLPLFAWVLIGGVVLAFLLFLIYLTVASISHRAEQLGVSDAVAASAAVPVVTTTAAATTAALAPPATSAEATAPVADAPAGLSPMGEGMDGPSDMDPAARA